MNGAQSTLKRIDREIPKKIDRETWLTLAPIIISVIAAVLSVVVTGASNLLLVFFVCDAFLVVALLGVITSYQNTLHQRRVDQVMADYLQKTETALDTRLPEIRFIRGNERELREAIVDAVVRAKTFIAATGGKARIEEYLKAIEKKVESREVRYTRVIPFPSGDSVQQRRDLCERRLITHQLCLHLCRLLESDVARKYTTIIKKDVLDMGYYLATDAGFIVFMPNPRPKAPFDSCISVPRGRRRGGTLESYREYIVDVLGGAPSQKIDKPSQVKQLCRICSKEQNTG